MLNHMISKYLSLMVFALVFSAMPNLVRADCPSDPKDPKVNNDLPTRWRPLAASTTLGASTDGKASGELAILFSLNKCPGKDFLETSFGNSGVGRTSTTDAAGAVSGLMIRQSLGFPQPLLPGQVENLRVTHWTTNYRRYFLPNHHNYYFFLSGGLGAYSLSPGGKEFGLNFKAGVAIPLKGYKRWELEFSGSYHHLATSGPNLDFGNVLMGVQYRWGKHGRE